MNGSATARISIAVATRVTTSDVLERVLQRQRVDDRGEHAHVVGGRAVHALGAGREAAEQVAAADDDRRLDAEPLDLADVLRDLGGDCRVDAERLLAHQGFAGELQQDATKHGDGHIWAIISTRARGGSRIADVFSSLTERSRRLRDHEAPSPKVALIPTSCEG